jgi:hypothetical protein
MAIWAVFVGDAPSMIRISEGRKRPVPCADEDWTGASFVLLDREPDIGEVVDPKTKKIERQLDDRFERRDQQSGAVIIDEEKKARILRRAAREEDLNAKARIDLIDDEIAPLIARIERLEALVADLTKVNKNG